MLVSRTDGVLLPYAVSNFVAAGVTLFRFFGKVPAVTRSLEMIQFPVSGTIRTSLKDHLSQRPRGRPPKDVALVLRDEYWARALALQAPSESLASIERKLCPAILLRERKDDGRFAQRHAISKVANGKLGLSGTLGHVPPYVAAAAEIYAGSAERFNSIFWLAISAPSAERDRLASFVGRVASDVRRRFWPRHFQQSLNVQDWRLNVEGIRRAGRLTNLDALGLLLLHCFPNSRTSQQSLVAESFVEASFLRLCKRDPAFMQISEQVSSVLSQRFPSAFHLRECRTAPTFRRRKVSALSVAFMTLVRGA